MIEIAIAIAVIGFALVAIIGILPMGLNVQKDNREDTIVNEDGRYFLDLIRYGRQGIQADGVQGTALDFLTNYVESITITKSPPPANAPTPMTYSLSANTLTNGQEIVDLLSMPRYESAGTFMFTNTVVATVRGMSGSATEQGGANSLVAFKYQMEVQLVPYSMNPMMIDLYTNYLLGITNTTGETNSAVAENQWHYWQNSLHELKLTFSWPILGNGKPGPNRRYFRSTVSGRVVEAPWQIDPTFTYRLYVIEPQTFRPLDKTGTNLTRYPVYPN